MVQSESDNRLMRGEVGLQHRDSGIQRERCGSNVSEAVETSSRDCVPDKSSDRKPVKGVCDS